MDQYLPIVASVAVAVLTIVLEILRPRFNKWFAEFKERHFSKRKDKYSVTLVQKECQEGASIFVQPNKRYDAVLNHIRKVAKSIPSISRFMQQSSGAFNPDENVPFELGDGVTCVLKNINKTGEDDGSGNNERSNRKLNKFLIRDMQLYSQTKNVSEILSWVKEKRQAHKQEQETERGDTRYFIQFEEKREGNLLFRTFPFKSTRSFENVFFQGKDEMVRQLDFFMKKEEWYTRRGIAHKTCFLFHGVPGCGKTSAIKAIANYTDRHIINVPLETIKTAQDLFDIFFCEGFEVKRAYYNEKLDIPFNKRIYLMEDIDAVDDVVLDRALKAERDRKKAEKRRKFLLECGIVSTGKSSYKGKSSREYFENDKVTLSTLLNILDGMLELSQQIIIITTNYPEKLDKALVRPGRVDHKVNFTRCDYKMLSELLNLFYKTDKTAEPVVSEKELATYIQPDILTPAEVCAICFQYKAVKSALKALKRAAEHQDGDGNNLEAVTLRKVESQTPEQLARK